MRNRRLSLALGACLLALHLAACSLPGGAIIEQTPEAVEIVGTLGADSTSCFWIQPTGAARTYLFLGVGIEGSKSAGHFVLTDGSGRHLAAEGDRVRASGLRPDFAQSICSDTPLFPADRVQVLDP